MLPRAPLVGFIAMVFTCTLYAGDADEQFEFDPSFLRKINGIENIDLSQFNKSQGFLAADYLLDVSINSNLRGKLKLTFKEDQANNSPQLCLNKKLLEFINIDQKKLTTLQRDKLLEASKVIGTKCVFFKDAIDFAKYDFDYNKLSINFKIPKHYQASGAAINYHQRADAAFVKYGFNYNNYASQNSQQNYNLNLGTGLLLPKFYLLHNGSLSNNNIGSDYKSYETYVGTGLGKGDINLLAGELFSRQQRHDNFKLYGLVLLDERPTLGWAPIIKGTANSFASVRILQNGKQIYQTNVTAGEFIIDDLSPIYGGNLEVEITEADNSVHRFWVYNRYTQALLRPQSITWQLALGALQAKHKPVVAAFSLSYGLSNNISIYSGANFSSAYNSATLGANIGSRLGATSLETSASHSKDFYKAKSAAKTGGKISLLHNINFANSNLSGHANFYMRKAYQTINSFYENDKTSEAQNLAAQYQLNYNQQLSAAYGSFNLGLGVNKYRQTASDNFDWNINYQNNYKKISYQLGWRQQLIGSKTSNSLQASLYINWGGANNIRSQHGVNQQQNDWQHHHGIMANSTGDTPINFMLNSNHSKHNSNYNANINATNSAINLAANYAYNANYKNLSASANGAVVAHAGGVNFTNSLGDSFAIIKAEHATGSQINNYAKIADNGYGIANNLTPWQRNLITLTPSANNLNLELDYSSAVVYPSNHSANLVHFPTKMRQPILFKLKFINQDGQQTAPPFGAQAVDLSNHETLGLVSDAGRLFINAELGRQYVIALSWNQQSCQFKFSTNKIQDLQIIGKLCTK